MRRASAAALVVVALWLALWRGPAMAQDKNGGQNTVPPPADSSIALVPRAPTDIRVHTSVTQKPTAGDIVELAITPSPAMADAKPVMAEDLKKGPVEWGTGRILWWHPNLPKEGQITVALTTYAPGPFEIGAITFEKDGKPAFATEPQSVEFVSIGGDKSQDDIYPPRGVGFPQWIWVVLGILLLAAVLVALWWLARRHAARRLQAELLARTPKILSPMEEFSARLAEIERKKLVDKGQYKPHYFGLSDASKRFLGRAFRFDAEERTTRELVRELERLGLREGLRDSWKAVFEEMDVTKFTDKSPEAEHARSLLKRLAELVATSYPQSPVAREAELVAAQAREARGRGSVAPGAGR